LFILEVILIFHKSNQIEGVRGFQNKPILSCSS
jgi:hypothetical protein